MYKKIQFSIVLILIFSTNVLSQWHDIGLVAPKPIGGDSIVYEVLEYRPLARKANVQSEFYALISIDSLGNSSIIKFSPIYRDSLSRLDSMLVPYVRSKLENIIWSPGEYNGRKINSKIKIPFIFKLTKTDNLLRSHGGPSKRSFDNLVFEMKPFIFEKRAEIIVE